MNHFIPKRLLPAVGVLALLAAMVGWVPPATLCRADDSGSADAGRPAPATEPATRPAGITVKDVTGPDGGLLHLVTPTTLPVATVTTAPSTQPASKPAVAIDAEAQPLLDAVRDAYKELASLHVAGTITGDFDINGQQTVHHGTFQGDYQARPDGPPRFRQTTHDDADKTPAAQDAVVGSTGDKLYFFDPAMKETQSHEAPKSKFAAGKMPRPYYDLLCQQDPSLLLAVVADAEAEILDGLVSVKKVEDVKIGDDPYPTLRLLDKDGNPTDLVFDPKTHLLRRSISDLREVYKKGQSDVNKVLITIDYTTALSRTSPGDEAKDDEFAFKAPEGTRELPEVAEAAPQLQPGGEASPAEKLVGKVAPDFKLKGMDDQEVSLSDLKGNVIVLDFWATWCGPCRASLPHLTKLYENKKGNGLKVFALDLKEAKDDVQQGITELKLTVPVLLDSDGKVAEKYLVNGIPQTVVIGKDGKVKKVIVGFGGSDAELRKAVEEEMK